MPRKNIYEKTIAAPIDFRQAPDPPPTMTEFQANLWREITATKPADWWNADSAPLLESYCRLVSQAALVDGQVEAVDDLESEDGLWRYSQLIKLRLSITQRIESLARSMRLTQQARYDKRVAANQSDGHTKRVKKLPWSDDPKET